MKKTYDIQGIEFGDNIYDASFNVHETTIDDYGADADGNRGSTETEISEVEITGLTRDGEVIDPKMVSDELKDLLVVELVEKIYS